MLSQHNLSLLRNLSWTGSLPLRDLLTAWRIMSFTFCKIGHSRNMFIYPVIIKQWRKCLLNARQSRHDFFPTLNVFSCTEYALSKLISKSHLLENAPQVFGDRMGELAPLCAMPFSHLEKAHCTRTVFQRSHTPFSIQWPIIATLASLFKIMYFKFITNWELK